MSPLKVWVAVWILLSVFVLVAGDVVRRTSATFDEGNHLVRGMFVLEGHGYQLSRDHPPLTNMLQAAPVCVGADPVLPPQPPARGSLFAYARRTLWFSGNDGRVMIERARYVTVFLGCLLGLVVFLFARDAWGDLAGLIALTLCLTSSQVLGLSALVTTDLAHALGVLATAYTVWRLSWWTNLRHFLIAGACLGGAIASKHTALLLIPLLLPYLLAAQRWGQTDLTTALGERAQPFLAQRGIFLRGSIVWGLLVGLAFFVLWAVYGFSLGPSVTTGTWMPMPRYVDGFGQRMDTLHSARVFFLDGERSASGWWSWFYWATLYKTPLPIFLLAGGAVVAAVRGWVEWPRSLVFMTIVLAVYCQLICLGRLNLGLRFLLPGFAFLFVLLGGLAEHRKGLVFAAPLLVWLAGGTFDAHPFHLARFNELVALDRRHHHLVDSNLDWGQGLPALADYQRRTGIGWVRLGYFGTAEPGAYGVRAEQLPSFWGFGGEPIPPHPRPPKLELHGVVAVSATLLQGLYLAEPEFYSSLRTRTPNAILGGGSILVFDLRNPP